MVIALFANCKAEESKSEKALQEALKGKFLIGVAMNADQITGKDTAGVRLIKQHFNSITPENCMKSEVLQPEEGKFDFAFGGSITLIFGQKTICLSLSIRLFGILRPRNGFLWIRTGRMFRVKC